MGYKNIRKRNLERWYRGSMRNKYMRSNS